MSTFYFTFGHGQNPGLGYYTTIEAEDEAEARVIMLDYYPSETNSDTDPGAWAFCYPSEEEAGVDKFSLTHVHAGFKYDDF